MRDRQAAGTQYPLCWEATTIQGETAAIAGVTLVKTGRSGHASSGFLDFPVRGGSAQFSDINGGSGETSSIIIRYAHGSPTARAGVHKVNGLAQLISFAPTGGWTNWFSTSAAVTRAAGGANVLRFEFTGQDLGNVHEIVMP
ncbi:MAG: carbohydrate-binding protein [Massilia sp.]|uniref:carbohydrate-binding protein n=1 Tax=Massilia sp. TaxID=1882437 RepID=UPI002FCA679B